MVCVVTCSSHHSALMTAQQGVGKMEHDFPITSAPGQAAISSSSSPSSPLIQSDQPNPPPPVAPTSASNQLLRRTVPSSANALVSSLTSLALSNPKVIQGWVHGYATKPVYAEEGAKGGSVGELEPYRRRLGREVEKESESEERSVQSLQRIQRISLRGQDSTDTDDTAGTSTGIAKRLQDTHLGSLSSETNPTSAAEEIGPVTENSTTISTSSANTSCSKSSPEDRYRYITGWKMTEHVYRRRDCPFPVLARGLFTANEDYSLPVIGGGGGISGAKDTTATHRADSRIVTRGYDKFFSIDEVAWTKWASLRRYTIAPYTLTFKSNGCLILISALSPTECLVSSKHALPVGPLPNSFGAGFGSEDSRAEELSKLKSLLGKSQSDNLDHATMGALWLRWTLSRAGKTEADLASELWAQNLTAVAELCDDTFEEHVLKISEKMTGLHLHGLNRNQPGFFTLPPEQVNGFADKWGFISMPFLQFDSLDDIKKYTDKVAKDGEWKGEEVEGFVIRSVASIPEDTSETLSPDLPPYTDGHSFFWKVKFDEPYLTYRQYREITRHLLDVAKKVPGDSYSFGKKDPLLDIPGKLKKPEFRAFANWCVDQIVHNPRLFDDYARGVVRVREAFLNYYTPEQQEQCQRIRKVKTMIIPVAVPGCGKTILGNSLAKLFGFAHTQSDDVTTKRTASGFLKNIQTLLKTNDVVYCDRNNHLDKHHEELTKLADSISSIDLDVRTVALVWDIDSHGFNKALRITSERVLGRGENHQSLRVDPADQMRHEIVIKNFMGEFAPPEGGRFNETINMKLEAPLRDNLQIVVDSLVKILGVEKPATEDVDKALQDAMTYKPQVHKELQGRATPEPRYFALAVELDLAPTVDQVLKSHPGADPSGHQFLQQLVTDSRITAKPHITIVHEKSVEAEAEEEAGGDASAGGPQTRMWNTCQELRRITSPARFSFAITALLWNDRVMTFVVEDVKPYDDHPANEHVQHVENALCEELKDVLHVTIGTADADIAPFEARGLVEAWRAAGKRATDGLHCIDIEAQRSSGRVMGLS